MDKKIHFSKYDNLNALDTEDKTYGCRCYNPDICKYYGGNSCAFCNNEKICFTPPRGWKKTFLKLKSENKENT